MTPREVSPIITIMQQGSMYILRIDDMRVHSLASKIAAMLPDAGSLLVITPTNTKLFQIDRQNTPPAPLQPTRAIATQEADLGAPPTPEAVESLINEKELDELAAQGDRDAAIAESLDIPVDKEKRKGREPSGEAGVCIRCVGTGELGTTGATCPVCRGKGSVQKFGVKRR